jgi:drug/metabolite transporter (DMT)-like permease
VTTNPIFVAIGSALLLKESVPRRVILGILVSFAGSIVIGWQDFQVAGDALTGDVLALAGAMAATSYLLVGRSLREKVDLTAYVFLVYSGAALCLVVTMFALGEPPVGYSTRTYLMFAALAIGPQIFGHTAINWCVRRISASVVAVAILGEPIVSAIAGWLILDESLSLAQLQGGVLILLGVYLATRTDQRAEG